MSELNETEMRLNARKVNGLFIGIDVFAFKKSGYISRKMTGKDLQAISAQLTQQTNDHQKDQEEIQEVRQANKISLIMHTMPGNDITCQASPFKQHQQTGSGLAVPYQIEQGFPTNGLPNLWVSPIPSTFKKSENKSNIGEQRYLIKQYIRQLYYYAGLGFAIAVPVRPRDEGSDKANAWKNKPNAFIHPKTITENAVLQQFSNEKPYEYAFGAGIDPNFCKNHGAFLEEELNRLEKYIHNPHQPKNKIKKKKIDPDYYYAAYEAGKAKQKDFQQCLAKHTEMKESLTNEQKEEKKSDRIDQCHILADHIDQAFMSLYTPPIPADAVIQDPALRKEITVAILRLKAENEALTDSETLRAEKTVKINALKTLLATENEKNHFNVAAQAVRAKMTDANFHYDAASKGIFSRTQKILEKIKAQYPEEPEEPTNANPFDWICYFFSHLIYEYLEKPNFDAKKTAFETHQRTNAKSIKVSGSIQTIYLPLTVPADRYSSFFKPSLFERTQTILNAWTFRNKNQIRPFYSLKSATNVTSQSSTIDDAVIIKAIRNTEKDGITYCFIEPKTGQCSDGMPAQNTINTLLGNAFTTVDNRKKETIDNTEREEKSEDDKNTLNILL